MKAYPPYVNASNVVSVVNDIIRLRQEDIDEVRNLNSGKKKGRIRTNTRGSVPSSASDVVAGDFEGDVVADATYIYTLVDVPGTGLRWHRVTLSTGW